VAGVVSGQTLLRGAETLQPEMENLPYLLSEKVWSILVFKCIAIEWPATKHPDSKRPGLQCVQETHTATKHQKSFFEQTFPNR
jgi:hypothetical protein